MSAGPARIYADWNATAPLAVEVRDAMSEALDGPFGNPSSAHAEGRRARDVLSAARRDVARWLGARPSEVVFTSGATEALNHAITVLGSGHAVATAVEHSAVLEPIRAMERARRLALTLVPVDDRGRLDPEQVATALRPETTLVAVMRANNETGNLYDTLAVAQILRQRAPRATLLVDATQAVGRIETSLDGLGADVVAVSAHKIGGPKGVGALVARGRPLDPLLRGGLQESGRRAGTENLLGIVGLAAAARLAPCVEHLVALGQLLRRELDAAVPGLIVHGEPDASARLPQTTSVRFPGFDADSLLIRLDALGVQLSAGSACTSQTRAPSHVLSALGLSPEAAFETVRISLGRTTSPEEVYELVARIARAVQLEREAVVAHRPKSLTSAQRSRSTK